MQLQTTSRSTRASDLHSPESEHGQPMSPAALPVPQLLVTSSTPLRSAQHSTYEATRQEAPLMSTVTSYGPMEPPADLPTFAGGDILPPLASVTPCVRPAVPPAEDAARPDTNLLRGLKQTEGASGEFFYGPLELFRRYRVVPWKLLMNIIILAVLLLYNFAIEAPQSTYEQNARFALGRLFFDAADNTDPSLTTTFTDIDAVVSGLRGAVENYYAFPAVTPGIFMHYVEGPYSVEPKAPVMRLTLLRNYSDTESYFLAKSRAGSTVTTEYRLTRDDRYVGLFSRPPKSQEPCAPHGDPLVIPCRHDDLAALFDRLVEATVTMQLRSVPFHPSPFGTVDHAAVVRWDVTFDIRFVSHGAAVSVVTSITPRTAQQPCLAAVLIATALLPLCLFDFLLRLRSFQRYHVHVRMLLPGQWGSFHSDGHSDHSHKERHAGTSWRVFAMVCDSLCALFATLTLGENFAPYSNSGAQCAKRLVLATAVLGYCLLFTSYLQTSPRFYVLIKALSVALPKLTIYLCGVTPIFFGFGLCATSVFGPFAPGFFGDFPKSIVTLFCLLNGDSVLQLFTVVNQTDFEPLRIFARLFIMVFLAYFINNALNVVLAIVQDAFAQVKDTFEVCQFDLDLCNERLETTNISAADRRRQQKQKRLAQRAARRRRRELQLLAGDIPTSSSSGSSSSASSEEQAPDAADLRRMAKRIHTITK